MRYQVNDSIECIPKVIRIDAELLIPGRGEPLSDASLIVEEGIITYVGLQDQVPDGSPSAEDAIPVPVLMPGLWDCHVHYFGCSTYSIVAAASVAPALAGARGARDLAATLNAGFTSVREVGGFGTSLAQTVRAGWLPGPNIYSSGSIISQTGGHADPQDDSEQGTSHTLLQVQRDQRSGAGVSQPLYICDGEDECMKAVRIMVRRGAQIIKVATSGAVSSPDSPHRVEFSPRELAAMVSEAGRAGLVVAAHCHGIGGIHAALEAGCHTLEHGSYLYQDPCAIETMVRRGTMLVATRAVLEFGIKHPEAWPKESFAKLLEVHKAGLRSYKAAIEAGVRIALGSDLGVSSSQVQFNHGMNGLEFVYAVAAGMTPLQAIEAGTANGPETLGPNLAAQLHSGQLRRGFTADLIALTDNPLQDITVLAQPNCVSHIWKAGVLCKAPGKPVTFAG